MLSDLHEELRRSVRDFVVKEVFPIADVLDSEEKDIPEEIIKKMAELGYFGLVFPDEVGGVGLDHLALTIVSEELSRGWLSVGSVLTRNLITGLLIQAHGSEEQKKRFLRGLRHSGNQDEGSARRGPLPVDRCENVVHFRQFRPCAYRVGADRSRPGEAPQGVESLSH
jgi:alkylation response protein AidB-like acyl-CoA dehydrogenase